MHRRDHSYWRFGTGNKQTLWEEPLARGEDVRKRLIEWQEKYYSANLMKLVVLGKGTFSFSLLFFWFQFVSNFSVFYLAESLDDMTKTVVEKFSAAPNRSLSPPIFSGSPLGEKELRVRCHVFSGLYDAADRMMRGADHRPPCWSNLSRIDVHSN